MSSVSSIALSGLNAASARLQASANNIANVSTPGSNVDLVGEAVQLLTARLDFAANVEVLKVDAKLTQALLDITV